MQNQVPSIPYAGCLTQVYIFLFFADLESFLLVVMAYDRYVAICFPLHYTSIMSFLLVVMAYDRYVVICFPLHYTSIRSPKLCVCLVVLSWVLTTFHAMLHTLLMARLSFCENNVIPHFFCDLSALVKLTCSDTHVNEFVMLVMGALIGVISFLLIIMSYARIVSSILKVLATQGIHKIFSTCGSHLCVVSLFYGTSGTLYLSPSTNNFVVKEIVMAVMYMVVTPMLNPFIYSLRNRDMNDTLRRVLCL
jgi:olfactory receptor